MLGGVSFPDRGGHTKQAAVTGASAGCSPKVCVGSGSTTAKRAGNVGDSHPVGDGCVQEPGGGRPVGPVLLSAGHRAFLIERTGVRRSERTARR